MSSDDNNTNSNNENSSDDGGMLELPPPTHVSPAKSTLPPLPEHLVNYKSPPEITAGPSKKKKLVKKRKPERDLYDDEDIPNPEKLPDPKQVSPEKPLPEPVFTGTKLSLHTRNKVLEKSCAIIDEPVAVINEWKTFYDQKKRIPTNLQLLEEDVLDIVYDNKKKSAVYARYIIVNAELFFRIRCRPNYYQDKGLPVRHRATQQTYSAQQTPGNLIKFHLIPMSHLGIAEAYANMALSRVVPFNAAMNIGPWKKAEDQDLKLSQNCEYCEVHVGELRVVENGKEIFTVLPNMVTVLNRLFRVTLYIVNGIVRLKCRGFTNEEPKTFVLDNYNIDLLEVFNGSGIDLFDYETLMKISFVNGEKFDGAQFINEINKQRKSD